MTDNKDDLENLEEDFADFDGDEFEDAGEEDFAESEEFVEEEWDSYDHDGDEQSAVAGGAKKSSLVFNLIIGLVVLGGVGYVGMKFMGGANSVQQPSVDVAQTPASNELEVPMQTAEIDYSAPPVSEPTADVASEAPSFAPPPSDPELDFDMPMPFSNEAPEDVSGFAPALSDSLDDVSVEAEPLTPLPMDDAISMQADVSTNVNSFDVSVSTSDAASSPSDVTTLESKLDLLFNRLDEIESKMGSVKGGEAASYDDSALKSSLAKLEKKVSLLSDKLSSGTVSNAAVDRPTYSAPSSTASARNDAPSSKASTWILTSAQPGKATIKKTGQGDVISIAVGDNVAGLGEITSIKMDAGKWVVNATNGKIVQ